MIRRGRAEGWLALPPPTLEPWAHINGCKLDGVQVNDIPGKGCGVIAQQELPGTHDTNVLMTVPRDLVLSLESVKVYAQADKTLSDILTRLGDFGNTTRGAILTFLLCQASLSCPDVVAASGPLRTPFTEYVKFLPLNNLPTSWASVPELSDALHGTTLGPALSAKLDSLRREFDQFQKSSKTLSWCTKNWWRAPAGAATPHDTAESEMENILSRLRQGVDEQAGEETTEDSDDLGLITFDDWLQVDHFYRSRALEFPGIGDATVPVIDMANHASGAATAALYECDENGDAVLVLRNSKAFSQGDEITITYGDNKGACEMLFSYGFIEDGMTDARELFLDLEIPGDDPLAMAKKHVANTAPGFKIFRLDDGSIDWEGGFIWWALVNEEDGLEFQVLQTNDGSKELKAFWHDEELGSGENTLLHHLETDSAMWDVFCLRAVAMLQARVQTQRDALAQSEQRLEEITLATPDDRIALDKIITLRRLESKLLEAADATFEDQKQSLLLSEQVQRYLSRMASDPGPEEEDFS